MRRYKMVVDHKFSSPNYAKCGMKEDDKGEWINIEDLAEIIINGYETGYDDGTVFGTSPRARWYAEFVIDSLMGRYNEA